MDVSSAPVGEKAFPNTPCKSFIYRLLSSCKSSSCLFGNRRPKRASRHAPSALPRNGQRPPDFPPTRNSCRTKSPFTAANPPHAGERPCALHDGWASPPASEATRSVDHVRQHATARHCMQRQPARPPPAGKRPPAPSGSLPAVGGGRPPPGLLAPPSGRRGPPLPAPAVRGKRGAGRGLWLLRYGLPRPEGKSRPRGAGQSRGKD